MGEQNEVYYTEDLLTRRKSPTPASRNFFEKLEGAWNTTTT